MFSRGERRVHIPRWQEYHLSVDETSAEWQSRTQPAPRRWSLEQLDAATRVSHRMESGKGMLLIEVQGCEPAKLLVSFAQRTEEPLLSTVRSDGRTSGFARHWMQICDESHLSCKRTGSVLPTRVIQLQIIHEELKARLLVTNGEEARYAALKKGIDFSELSHTFREALEIAAGIGLQYIWIDALCILQDDDHDWARESAKMGDVYRHAAITINAFASADGMGQCTTAYPPNNLVDYACRIGGEVYVHEEDGGFADVYELEGIIQTRGWVFQEEQLSPRRLYCGKHHLVWKCAEMWARNDRPCGFSGEVFDKPFMSTYPCSNWSFAYRQWRRMVQSYTRHNLTYAAKDKLPAISGLAAVFEQGFPGHHVGDYLGGIWRGDIYRGLLWYRDGNAIDRDRRIEGPSWSWASWDGPINFVFEDDDAGWPARMTWQPQRKYPCKVREASTTLMDPDNKYGRVSSGRIVVKGKVLMNAGRSKDQVLLSRSTLSPAIQTVSNVRLHSHSRDPTTYDLTFSNEQTLSSIAPHTDTNTSPNKSSPPLALPALTHPHIHLDKAYIHNSTTIHPQTGSFQEALTLTTQAKATFTEADLHRRGEWLLSESILNGVTALRAFIEIDNTVHHKCLTTAIHLKHSWRNHCHIQLVAFAQDPLFSGPNGQANRDLMNSAFTDHGAHIDVLGVTPYVESDLESAKKNIQWAITTAWQLDKHLDFHLDYHLDPTKGALVWFTLFGGDEWERLKLEIGAGEDALQVSFVGLPSSDLYMAAPPLSSPSTSACDSKEDAVGDRVRGTIRVPDLIRRYGLDVVLGVNNVGNAFTPWGSVDPVALACLGVGVYQAGTVEDAELLYECVSTRARAAIGLGEEEENGLRDFEY
ncbi:hypothetical protein BDV33DRAFT_231470 [Aspergillus novoparasiticus]|uniref:Heterokaryon incompatibility domain-containing protein n=1 Tax=Aspergillus novoparasiticus TaxID=986946 RepID=A0A5N6ET42_9EURO|nr:hypothetical protein BDV33DRAFT_231470 [Aspergillus novoparasiticus]